MAEFFLELFSEEIPARMQAGAAGQLEGICAQVLKPLQFRLAELFYGPRRLALRAEISSGVAESAVSERGPRINAPEQAVAGFLRKHGADKTELVQEGDFWVLNRTVPGQSAAGFIQSVLPDALIKLPWPKSMRWGASGDFTWVRPLRRIVCLLDGEVIQFTLGPVTAGDETEGHRVHGPGPFTVSSAAVWEEKLREHYVIVSQDERREKISAGLAALAAAENLSVAPDDGLLDEVTGLVEWPVPLLGRIDDDFMGLPPEVRELSMKINQKYFALRDAAGKPAPYFAFVANLAAEDEGKAIIAGNERVLRARLADARHFWDMDLKTPLDALLPKLEKVTFHKDIGTQLQRANRIADKAYGIAVELLKGEDPTIAMGMANTARWAGLLCKADLVTGMVGEFPELQGVIGGYYAEKNAQKWDGAAVGAAIKTHYQPKGPSDAVPTGTVAASVALADKLDTLIKFFDVGEKPTGSGDPYALRRAALGVIRIILENELRLPLRPLLAGDDGALFDFFTERLRVKLRGEGKRFDILDAVLAARPDDDMVRVMKRVEALEGMLDTDDGKNLLAAFKRAANILRIEDAKDGPHSALPDPRLFEVSGENEKFEEIRLWGNLQTITTELYGPRGVHEAPEAGQEPLLAAERYEEAMSRLATLRPTIDAFFEKVTVNVTDGDNAPELRLNRLRLLARFVGAVQQVADFSKIEG